MCRVWLPPPKYRCKEARNQKRCLDADFVSSTEPAWHLRERRNATSPEHWEYAIFLSTGHDKVCGLRFEEQTDCDDASDDFIEEQLHFKHSFIGCRSMGRADFTTSPHRAAQQMSGFNLDMLAPRC
jgi:hypothetical protein